MAQQLSHAKGGGALRVLRVGQGKAGGCGHLHHRRPVRQKAVLRPNVLPVGAGADCGHPLAAAGGEKCVHAALASVRHGKGDNLCFRKNFANCAGQLTADLP
ncbi:hypothetical protein SDC9_187108 [bioreactor metagenome]|uniref:Uncharacterized protein n=1 Tax=bioreactor metagenome TaxID=1076179 RepID=A0A645HLD8_9ZZZZ